MRASGPTFSSRGVAVVVTVAALVLGAGSASAAVGAGSAPAATGTGSGPRLRGFVVDPPPQVGALALPDVTSGGTDLAFAAPQGGLLLVYFGYTACPDICPTTLSDLGVALRKLGREAQRVQVAMVTVDPERDTPSVLDGYVGHFIPQRHHALRTDDPARLATVADTFGAKYEVRKDADGTVEVGHSAFVYAVDDHGTVRVVWPFGTPPRAVTKDLRTLLRAEARA